MIFITRDIYIFSFPFIDLFHLNTNTKPSYKVPEIKSYIINAFLFGNCQNCIESGTVIIWEIR